MTHYPTQPRSAPGWQDPDRDWPPHGDPDPSDGRSRRFTIAVLVLLALAVPCVAAFLVYQVFFAGSPLLAGSSTSGPTDLAVGTLTLPISSPLPSSAPGEAAVTVSPDSGYIGTLLTVVGQGWWPGEPVFVFLRAPSEGEGAGYSYAAAVTDNDGQFSTMLTFPNEGRWIGQAWAEVIARGSRSGFQAGFTFTLLAPTPTSTPVPPTDWPTSPPTETPVVTATPSPTPVITDWRGEYYANPSLSGLPDLVRNDGAVDFDWGEGAPASGLPSDGFSARWLRRVYFGEGFYRFTVAADDGVRFYVDGHLLVDEWHDSPFIGYPLELFLPAGDRLLTLEYYENVGNAQVRLGWAEVVGPTATPSPSPTLTPTSTPTPAPTLTSTPSPTATPTPTATTLPVPPNAWLGEYYANRALSGIPALVRVDDDVLFDWGGGSPSPLVPADEFSARWTQTAWKPANTYVVEANTDDGVRVWIDGLLLIDEWHLGSDVYMASVELTEGLHTIRIEYFEAFGSARMQFKIVTDQDHDE